MMADTITIKKGLDIPIAGVAEKRITNAMGIKLYAVKPTDFVGLTPRLLVEEGDVVATGDALFCDKNDERIRFTCVNDSGCSGAAMERGKNPESETAEKIYRRFPFWFCENYYKYSGKEHDMPFDQHWLIASVAPRHSFVYCIVLSMVMMIWLLISAGCRL